MLKENTRNCGVVKKSPKSRLYATTASTRARANSSRARIAKSATKSKKNNNNNNNLKKKKQTKKTKLKKTKTITASQNKQINHIHTTSSFTSAKNMSSPPSAPSTTTTTTTTSTFSVFTPRSKMTPRSKSHLFTTTPRSKVNSILRHGAARRPTPQSRQAKQVQMERAKNRLQVNSIFSTKKKGRITGQPKRSARRPTRRVPTNKQSGRKLIESVSLKLQTPGNDRIKSNTRSFISSPANTPKMKINFGKSASGVNTPAARKQMIDRLTAAISAISDNQEKSKAIESELLTSVIDEEEEETSDASDAEVQQLLSRENSPIDVTTRCSAFSRLVPGSYSPITISPSAVKNRNDPLGRTLKLQTTCDDAIRGLTKVECCYDLMEDSTVFDMDEDEHSNPPRLSFDSEITAPMAVSVRL